MKKGLLMMLTGNADDKIVSAFGQVFRALGHGVKVCVIEFGGESWLSRSHFREQFKDLLTVHTLENDAVANAANSRPDSTAAREMWQFAKESINSGAFEMVVLSEFMDLLANRTIDEHEAVDFLSNRPADLHVIITGADPPQLLIDAADLVTAINRAKE
jgi:cob(I)alamin adenosyltransferase